MKTRILLMSLAAASLALTSCNKKEMETGEPQELRLSSNVTAHTRAFNFDTKIANTQKVTVYVDRDGSTALYEKNVLNVDGSGNLTGGTAMFFPTTGIVNLDIYAFAGKQNHDWGTNYPTAAVTHSVEANQTTAAAYADSDLLYAASKNVAPITTAVPLTFRHMLSKVEVALKAGTGAPDLTGATVQILNTKLKVGFKPNKTKDATAQADCAGMLEDVATSNDPTPITILTPTPTADFNSNPTYSEAVIVPQTLADGTPFIAVTPGGGVLTYKLSGSTPFESGKKYQYQITVDATGLVVTSTVTDWEPGATVPGNAGM